MSQRPPHIPLLKSLLCLALSLPASLGAQEVEPQDLEEMEALNQQGFDAFAQGDFEQAATLFAQAYKILPDPNLLKNESIAWYKQGNCPKATMAAELFIRSPKVKASDTQEAKEIIATCGLQEVEAQLDSGQWNKAEQMLNYKIRPLRLGSANESRANELQERIDKERTAAKAREELPPPQAPPPPTPPPLTDTATMETPAGQGPNWLGWGIAGGGAALLLTAAIVHVQALENEDEYELEAMGGDRARYEELGDSLGRDRVLVPLLYLGSAVLLGTGTYLLLQPHRSEMATNNDLIHGGTLQWHVQF